MILERTYCVKLSGLTILSFTAWFLFELFLSLFKSLLLLGVFGAVPILGSVFLQSAPVTGNDCGYILCSRHLSEEEWNQSAIHWTACHKAVCESHNENRLAGRVTTPKSPQVAAMRPRWLAQDNETLRPRIDVDGVRKPLATALEHDEPLSESRECDGLIRKPTMPILQSTRNLSILEACPTTTEPFLRWYHLPYHTMTASRMMYWSMKETPQALNRYLTNTIPFKQPQKCRACGENYWWRAIGRMSETS